MADELIDSGTPAADATAGNPPADGTQPPASNGDATLLDDAGSNPTPPAANATPAIWPENWRDQMGGNNDKLKGVLARFTSPTAVAEALLATRQKLSSGEFKKGLGENPTPQELAAYREENGIPETHDKYDTTLDGGLVIGDDEKPYVDSFLKEMHAINAPQSMVKQALKAYAANVQAEQDRRAEADETARVSSEDKLRAEWGNDYRTNLNGATSFLNTLPDGFKSALLSARDAQGNLLRTNPDVVRALADLSAQLNPIASVMPGSGANAQQAMETEMETMQKLMGDYNSEYWKGPKDEQGRTKMQARYQQLLEAKERSR